MSRPLSLLCSRVKSPRSASLLWYPLWRIEGTSLVARACTFSRRSMSTRLSGTRTGHRTLAEALPMPCTGQAPSAYSGSGKLALCSPGSFAPFAQQLYIAQSFWGPPWSQPLDQFPGPHWLSPNQAKNNSPPDWRYPRVRHPSECWGCVRHPSECWGCVRHPSECWGCVRHPSECWECVRHPSECWGCVRRPSECWGCVRHPSECWGCVRHPSECWECVRHPSECWECVRHPSECWECVRHPSECWECVRHPSECWECVRHPSECWGCVRHPSECWGCVRHPSECWGCVRHPSECWECVRHPSECWECVRHPSECWGCVRHPSECWECVRHHKSVSNKCNYGSLSNCSIADLLPPLPFINILLFSSNSSLPMKKKEQLEIGPPFLGEIQFGSARKFLF